MNGVPPAGLWLLPAGAFCLALVLTGLLRRYALARRLLDVPNPRSSHRVPTPRGGGLAIVVSFLLALSVGWRLGWFQTPLVMGLAGAGGWVALVGFIDDHGHVPAWWRLLAHFAAAGWALACLGGVPPLRIFGLAIDSGWVWTALALVYLAWLLNLYNFMDGIDGIAGIEAICVCAGAALCIWLALPDGGSWFLPVVLLAAVLGFLIWNLPPARIFMGDVGSGFLGLVLGVMSVYSAWLHPSLFWAWVILLGVFVVDASITLLRRIVRGERFHEAHRSHAYQYASRRLAGHRPVSIAVGAIDLFWLLPFAVAVSLGRLEGMAGVLLAYAPLVWLAFRFKAGARELQGD